MWKLQSSVPSVCVEASYQSRLDDVFFFYCYLKWRLFFNKKCQMNWIWSASRQNIVVVSKNQFNLKGIKGFKGTLSIFCLFCGSAVILCWNKNSGCTHSYRNDWFCSTISLQYMNLSLNTYTDAFTKPRNSRGPFISLNTIQVVMVIE